MDVWMSRVTVSSDAAKDVFRIFIYCGGFSLLRLFLPIATTQPIRIKLSKKKTDQWRWFNIMVSLCHSTISGIWCLICFIEDPQLTSDIVDRHSSLSKSLAMFSTGYFFYDAFDYFFGLPVYKSWEILLHHTVVTTCFGVAVIKQQYIGYVLLALLVEVNSVFLHTRQLLRMAGIDIRTTLYSCVSKCTVITFIIFRGVPLSYMTYWMFLNRELIPFSLVVLGSTGLFVMHVMNIVLFIRLLKKDFHVTRRIVLNSRNGNFFKSVYENTNKIKAIKLM